MIKHIIGVAIGSVVFIIGYYALKAVQWYMGARTPELHVVDLTTMWVVGCIAIVIGVLLSITDGGINPNKGNSK